MSDPIRAGLDGPSRTIIVEPHRAPPSSPEPREPAEPREPNQCPSASHALSASRRRCRRDEPARYPSSRSVSSPRVRPAGPVPCGRRSACRPHRARAFPRRRGGWSGARRADRRSPRRTRRSSAGAWSGPGAADRGAAALAAVLELLDGSEPPGRRTSPRRSASSRAVPARDVGLGGARVVDDLPLRQMPRRSRAPAWHIAAVREKFPDATTPTERSRAAESISPKSAAVSPEAADHHGHPGVDRGERVRLDRRRRREVDEDIDAVERFGRSRAPGPPSASPPSASPRSRPDAERLTAEPSSRSGASRTADTSARPVQPVAPAMHTDSSGV